MIFSVRSLSHDSLNIQQASVCRQLKEQSTFQSPSIKANLIFFLLQSTVTFVDLTNQSSPFHSRRPTPTCRDRASFPNLRLYIHNCMENIFELERRSNSAELH
jgi:hypothetical protein